MTFTRLLQNKKQSSEELKNTYSFPKGYKAIGAIRISDTKVLKKLLKGCRELQVNFIVITDHSFDIESKNIAYLKEGTALSAGMDFVICDESTDCITQCFEHGITPIIANKSNVASLVSQFNPMKSEGNAYVYESVNEWAIFASLIRYLENYKFSFDNKNLVKNVFES